MPICPICNSADHECFESVALTADGKVQWVCMADRSGEAFADSLADIVKLIPREKQ